MRKVVAKMEHHPGRENRLQKIGMLVTAAPQDRLIDKLKPSYHKRRQSLLTKVNAMLKDEQTTSMNAKKRRLAIGSGNAKHQLQLRIEKQEAQDQKLAAQFSRRVDQYQSITLEVMVDKGAGWISSIAKSEWDEHLIRESLSYASILGDLPSVAKNLLDNLRQCGPQFAYQDLSSLAGEDRAHAENILKLGVLMRESELSSQARHHGSSEWKEQLERVNKRRYVSQPLAALLGERPDAIDAIVGYLEVHPMPVTEDEVGHFNEYLNVPSKALAIGVL